MSEFDIRYRAACGWTEIELPVADLRGAALWWTYETCRSPDTRDMRIDDDGDFLTYLNDDANPPGWYHYQPRAGSEEQARQFVIDRAGTTVKVPIKALLPGCASH